MKADGISLNKPNVQCILGKTFYVFKTTNRSPSGSNDSMKGNTGNNNAEKAGVSSTYELINSASTAKISTRKISVGVI